MGAQNSSNYECGNNNLANNNVPSDLYIACFEGNINSVRETLKDSPFENINRKEPNGSTALHTAVEGGHVEIVRLLLHEYGVIQHLTDKDGRTAFQLAQTDEMRRLFQRSAANDNRFYGNEKLGTVFSLQYWDVYCKFYGESNSVLYNSVFGWWKKRSKLEKINRLRSIIDEHVGPSNTQYAKAVELVQTFSKTEQSYLLIRLFSLETPFYRFINERQESSMAFFLLFEQSMNKSFHGREFEGICYRGLSMTQEDLQIYEWARQKKDRYLEINTFCSSIRDGERAKFHAEANQNDQRRQVLMIFEFSQICHTAIRLDKVSDTFPSISQFEDEQEVLILPSTIFSIKKIVSIQSLTIICLIHCNFEEERWKYFNLMVDNAISD